MLIWGLRLLFAGILISMLIVTSWASLTESILKIPPVVTGDPWFIATLFDAYFGFTTFYVWVAYRAKSPLMRGVWFVAIMLLGNIAMAGYMLNLLFRLPVTAGAREILLRPEDWQERA